MPGKCLWEGEGKNEEGKNHVSCIVATFSPCTGKERGQETKKHLVCLEKCCRTQLPLQFMHQLIYGRHAAVPVSSGPGERQSGTVLKSQTAVPRGNLHDPFYRSINCSVATGGQMFPAVHLTNQNVKFLSIKFQLNWFVLVSWF